MTFLRLRTDTQNRPVAARAMADRNTFGHLSLAGCDTPSVLQSAKHDLGTVAAFVAALVVFDGLFPRLSPRDERSNIHIYKVLAEPIGVRAAISEQPICCWKAAHESTCADSVEKL